jgi:cytochrome c-type biogenesis protein CcmH
VSGAAIAVVEEYLPPEERAVAASGSPTITLTIDISPELAAQVSDDMSLFVFVRSSAMAAPLVAQRFDTVPEFPLTLTLDNSNAMLPGVTLESAPELLAGARLSRSGQAIAQSGDLQTLSGPFMLSDRTATLELVIDAIAP